MWSMMTQLRNEEGGNLACPTSLRDTWAAPPQKGSYIHVFSIGRMLATFMSYVQAQVRGHGLAWGNKLLAQAVLIMIFRLRVPILYKWIVMVLDADYLTYSACVRWFAASSFCSKAVSNWCLLVVYLLVVYSCFASRLNQTLWLYEHLSHGRTEQSSSSWFSMF